MQTAHNVKVGMRVKIKNTEGVYIVTHITPGGTVLMRDTILGAVRTANINTVFPA